MSGIRLLLGLGHLVSLLGLMIGLSAQFGIMDLPKPFQSLWTHIPTLGYGLLGQVGLLFIATIVCYGLYLFVDAANQPAYAYFR